MSKEHDKYEFSITFWIRINENPGWKNIEADINFPPFTVKHGIIVYFSKYGEELKIYLLHPELGYRKLVVNIKNYLNKDTFIALTNSSTETKLYLNANLVTKIDKDNLKNNLEVGDYVMVEIQDNDFNDISIGSTTSVLTPAKIKKIFNNSAQFELLNLGPKIKVIDLPIERIKY